MGRLGLGLAVGALLTTLGRTGQAQSDSLLIQNQNGDGMDTHLFRPAVDSRGYLAVNGTDVVAARDFCFGLVLDYGRNILRTNPLRTNRGSDALIENSFQGTLLANYGVTSFASVGLTLPLVLMASGAVNDIGRTGDTYNTQGIDSQRLAGVAAHGKVRVLPVEKGLGVGAIVQGGIPVAGAPLDLAADPGFWYWPRVMVERWFMSGGRLRAGLEAGYRGHTGANPRFGRDSNVTRQRTQLTEGRLQYGNLWTFGAGVSWQAGQSIDLVGETYGTYLIDDWSDTGQKLSMEFAGGVKLYLQDNSYLMMGVGSRLFSNGFEAADQRLMLGFLFEPMIGDSDGDGIKDDEDKCPSQREDRDGFEDDDGCPDPDNDGDGILDADDRCPDAPEDFDGNEDHDGCPEGEVSDSDNDGVLDNYDKCPDKKEDMDGFKDNDGCPDRDNDDDGIPDAKDKCPDKAGDASENGCPNSDSDQDQIPDERDDCPNEPETYNGFEDGDGCPDKGRVVVEGHEIVILDQVQFASNRADMLPQSKAVLDAVESTLRGHPEFVVIEVEGHADERGDAARNLRLTQARAAAVVREMQSRGIPDMFFVSQGYGSYCPLDAGSHEKNRRVEFKVVKTEKGLTNVKRGCPRASAAGVEPPPVK